MLNFKFYNYLKSYQKEVSKYVSIGNNNFLYSNKIKLGGMDIYWLINLILLDFNETAIKFRRENSLKSKFTIIGTKPTTKFLMDFSKDVNCTTDEDGRLNIKLNDTFKTLNCYIEPTNTNDFELYLVANINNEDAFISKKTIVD